MSMTNTITARTFIWLTAFLFPLQGLSSAPCRCANGKSCCSQKPTECCRCTGAKICRCRESSPCRKVHHSCCSADGVKQTCWGTETSTIGDASGCNCGMNCPCRENNQPAPATPPVENNHPSEKVTSETILIAPAPVVLSSLIKQPHDCLPLDAMAALDRCVSLCRFTL